MAVNDFVLRHKITVSLSQGASWAQDRPFHSHTPLSINSKAVWGREKLSSPLEAPWAGLIIKSTGDIVTRENNQI